MHHGVFGHEQVAFCHDRATGLRAIVALYSTVLGPGLGGTRFYPYASEDDALEDVLDLSRAMAYKNSLAGLDHGGGKAVIIGDPRVDKTPDLLRAYGRFVQGLGGRYITAADVGTYVQDMDVIAEVCDHVTGRSPERGGAGDSSVLTAFGVHQGMRAAAQHVWGDTSLAGKRIGIAGIGKVGRHLVGHAREEGAVVVATDVDPAALDWARREAPEVELVADTKELLARPLDVYAPCALGGALDDHVAATIDTAIVCGAANNQLADDHVDDVLAERGVVYCPDFLVNAGGVIQVADERHGFDFERAHAKTASIFDTLLDVLVHRRRPWHHPGRGRRRPGRGADGRGRRPHLDRPRSLSRSAGSPRDSGRGGGAEGPPHRVVDAGPGRLGPGQELAQPVDGAGPASPLVERDDDPPVVGPADRQVDAGLAGVDADRLHVRRPEQAPLGPAPAGQLLLADRPRAAERLHPHEPGHHPVDRAEHEGGVAPDDRPGHAAGDDEHEGGGDEAVPPSPERAGFEPHGPSGRHGGERSRQSRQSRSQNSGFSGSDREPSVVTARVRRRRCARIRPWPPP